MTAASDRLAASLADRYRVERELGQGGMATVYLAEDIRHHRKVAIKVLLPELSAILGPERFLKEIQLTANLQHPHILPLFDSGNADGLLFYVMPYVEGEALRDRLEREGELPVSDSIRIATEVADALEYAHKHGVVHRDIKPENILLHEGRPLVADFGIALAVQQAGGERMTQTGISLGTPQYMAPEQAMGDKTVDHRADIYALGAITYEMLCGEPPFTGPNAQAIVAKVLTTDATSLRTKRRSVPPAVEDAVLTALEKKPADRFASVAQFAAALGGEHQRPLRPTGRAAVIPWRKIAIGLAVASIVLASGFVWSLLRSRSGAELPMLTARIIAASDSPSDLSYVALSPDETQLAYVSSAATDGGRIWLRKLSDGTAKPLADTEGARMPFWSPDGSAIAFYAAGSLKVVTIGSGAVRTLAPAPNPAPGGAWSSRGIILYSPFFNGFWKVQAAGGTPRQIAGAVKDDHDPEFLPDGRHFLYGNTGGGDEPAILSVGDIETGKTRELARGVSSVRYVAPGYLLFFQATRQAELMQPAQLFAQRFDAEKMKLEGEPFMLSPRVERPDQIAAYSATPRFIVFRESEAGSDARAGWSTYWLDRATGRTTPIKGSGPTWTFRISHDGRRAAFGGLGLWLYDPDRDVTVRVPTANAAPWPPVWSPDDRRIAVVNGPRISLIPIEGRGSEQVVEASDDGGWADPVDWSPDGAAIYFVREPAARRPQWELWRHVLGTGRNEHVPSGPGNVFDASLSPDGKWIAWESDASGRREIYIGPTTGDATPLRVSKAGGGSPRWRGDGRELFYIAGDGRITAASIQLGDRPVIGEPRAVADIVVNPEPFGTSPFLETRFDVTPSGDRILVQTPPDVHNRQLTVIQGWQARVLR